MSLKAVLFDLDDTLYDHRFASAQAVIHLQQSYPCFAGVPEAEFEREHRELLEQIHLRILRGELTLDQGRLERYRELLSRYGAVCDEEAAHTAWRAYRQYYLSCERPISGAQALLEAVRAAGLKIGIVTNNAVGEQTEKLNRMGWHPLIDALVISEAVGKSKPHPDIFAVALRQLGVTADEAVMIGDSWSADIQGAANAGIRAIWLNRFEDSCPAPEMAQVITSLEPIEAFLQLLTG
jgi:HAD superfamily hydrolase (TIGR01509 family)